MNGFMKGMMLGVVLFAGVNAFYTAEGSSFVEGSVMDDPADCFRGKREVLRKLRLEKKSLLGCRASFESFILDSNKRIDEVIKEIRNNEDLLREFDEMDAKFYEKNKREGKLSEEDLEGIKQGKFDRHGDGNIRERVEMDKKRCEKYIPEWEQEIAAKKKKIEEIDAEIKDIDEKIVELESSINAQIREIEEESVKRESSVTDN